MSVEEFERGVLLYRLFRSYMPGSQLGSNYAAHWAGFASRYGAELLELAATARGFPVPSDLRLLEFPAAHDGREFITRHTMLAAARGVLEAPDDATRAVRFIDLSSQIDLMFAKWPPPAAERKNAA